MTISWLWNIGGASFGLTLHQITVKPVLSGHSKLDKTKILMTNGSFMKVESIAECSPWSILQYFWPSLSGNQPWKPFLFFFLSGHLRQVLLYILCVCVSNRGSTEAVSMHACFSLHWSVVTNAISRKASWARSYVFLHFLFPSSWCRVIIIFHWNTSLPETHRVKWLNKLTTALVWLLKKGLKYAQMQKNRATVRISIMKVGKERVCCSSFNESVVVENMICTTRPIPVITPVNFGVILSLQLCWHTILSIPTHSRPRGYKAFFMHDWLNWTWNFNCS